MLNDLWAALLPHTGTGQADTGTARFFTDSAPILERYWAWQAGLGWIG